MKHNITRNEDGFRCDLYRLTIWWSSLHYWLDVVSMLPIIEELEGSIERDDCLRK